MQANPVWAETELVNASEVRGNIVLIERGKTPFVEKARARPPALRPVSRVHHPPIELVPFARQSL